MSSRQLLRPIEFRVMRLWPLLAVLTAAPAFAFTGETVGMRDGGSNDARDLPPIWLMACAPRDRLVGLRVHQDGKAGAISGVQAFCAPLSQSEGAVRWLADPQLGPEPLPPAPPPEPRYETRVIRRQGEGTILEARSGDIRRYRTQSHAEIITIDRPLPEVADATDRGGETPDSITFEEAEAPADIVCPRNSFVAGLKAGTAANRLAAVQIVCGDGTNRPVATMGDWPPPAGPVAATTGTRRHRRVASRLTVQRIECNRDEANPHDGMVGQAVFGTIGEGEIDSIGLSCARSIAGGSLD